MESLTIDARKSAIDGAISNDSGDRFGAESDDIFASWNAEWIADRVTEQCEVGESQRVLDRLLKTRSATASLQADEQQLLAQLEAIALHGGDGFNDPVTAGASQEIAWRSMVAEIAVAPRTSDRTVQAMLGRATALIATPLTR